MNALPSAAAELAAFGQAATLTPPGGDPVEVTVIVTTRPSPLATGMVLGGPAAELRPEVAIPRADLPDVASPADLRGWTVTTAIHGRDRVWTVGVVDVVDPHYWRVRVS